MSLTVTWLDVLILATAVMVVWVAVADRRREVRMRTYDRSVAQAVRIANMGRLGYTPNHHE